MSENMDFYDELKEAAPAIEEDAKQGDTLAQEVINLYRLHCLCQQDPGAFGLCEAAFKRWQKK